MTGSIKTAANFQGRLRAVFQLKEQYPNTCVVILYHLEAAIRGIEMKQLDDSCKAELKACFKRKFNSKLNGLYSQAVL